MDVDGAVAKEASQTGLGRNVKVRVSRRIGQRDDRTWNTEHLLSCEWAYSDVAVLARKISDLAGFRLGVVAGRDLATDVRIKMRLGRSTVTIRWDRF